jgi:leucyl aminopeptidase
MRTILANVIRTAQKMKSKNIYLFVGYEIPVNDTIFGHILSEAALLSSYKFDKYLSDAKAFTVESIHVVMNTKNPATSTAASWKARSLPNPPYSPVIW